MPVIVKLPSGNWRAQVRRKRKYISNTFRRRADADTWAHETERTIDKRFDPKAIIPSSVKTFGEIIDLHVQDMLEVGKKIRRSKNAWNLNHADLRPPANARCNLAVWVDSEAAGIAPAVVSRRYESGHRIKCSVDGFSWAPNQRKRRCHLTAS